MLPRSHGQIVIKGQIIAIWVLTPTPPPFCIEMKYAMESSVIHLIWWLEQLHFLALITISISDLIDKVQLHLQLSFFYKYNY